MPVPLFIFKESFSWVAVQEAPEAAQGFLGEVPPTLVFALEKIPAGKPKRGSWVKMQEGAQGARLRS